MTNIFPVIQNIHSQLTGWCSWQKAQILAALVIGTRPKVIVEIGVWGGKSLIPMAIAQQACVPGGKCYAIDPWKAEESVAGQLNEADKQWWAEQGKHEYAYSEFIRYRRIAQLEDVIVIQRAPSNDVPVPPEIGILHCDGNHGVQAMTDIDRFAPAVVAGGFVILDDLQWTGGAVAESAKRLESLGMEQLYIVNDPDTANQWGVWQLKVKP